MKLVIKPITFCDFADSDTIILIDKWENSSVVNLNMKI